MLMQRYLNLTTWMSKSIKECNFVKAFTVAGLRNFIFEVPHERFPTLVRMFYAKLKYTYGTLGYRVKKYPIQLSLKEFAQFLDLPCNNYEYDESEGNRFNFDLDLVSFFTNQSSIILTEGATNTRKESLNCVSGFKKNCNPINQTTKIMIQIRTQVFLSRFAVN